MRPSSPDPRLVAALAAFPAPLGARLDRTAAALGLTPIELVRRLVWDQLDRLDRQTRSRSSRDRTRRSARRAPRR
jgi:hypothetical protein